MPDVQGSCTLHTLAPLASSKFVKWYRSKIGCSALVLFLGAAVFSAAAVQAGTQAASPADKVATAELQLGHVDKVVAADVAEVTSQRPGDASAVPAREVGKPQDDAVAHLRAVQDYIQSTYKVPGKAIGTVVETAWEVGASMKLDPLLLLAVMAIESSFNPRAESHMGAQGLMQVMTRIHHKKFEPFGGRKAAWMPDANINVGAQILKDCIARRGSISGGLTCYVGSPGTSSKYGRKVLAERERLLAAVAPLQRKGLMLASSDKGAESAKSGKAQADANVAKVAAAKAESKTQVAARTRTVDEEAAAIVAGNSDSQVAALSEATASLTLRTGSFEM